MNIDINGVQVRWALSKGRKLRLTISPKTAEAVIHVPPCYTQAQVLEFLKQNTDWIKKYQNKIEQKILTANQKNILENGKRIYLWGLDYKLKIISSSGYSSVDVDDEFIYIKEGKNASVKKRNLILNKLYKTEMEIYIKEILPFWEKTVKEKPSQIKFRDMKSKWGSCNTSTGIILLNIKLAAFPYECAEMVLVHELIHFKEILHNDRFKKYMSLYLPDWKNRLKLLNSDNF